MTKPRFRAQPPALAHPVFGALLLAFLTAPAVHGLDEPAQYWHAGVKGFEVLPGECQTVFCLGVELAVGDFDGDGFADLVMASDHSDVAGVEEAGAVYVLAGGAAGLTLPATPLWQGSPGSPDSPKPLDRFGTALAAGDFNADGADDLAVGVPWNDGGGENAGGVQVFYGVVGRELGNGPQVFLSHDSPGMPGKSAPFQLMGWGLAAGDFDGDGFTDLAIGSPGENGHRGRVDVVRGGSGGLDPLAGVRAFDQDTVDGADFMLDDGEQGDSFGQELAAGDFNTDGFADLAIGVPVEDSFAGAVAVVFGSAGGLVVAGNQLWRPDTAGYVLPVVSGLFGQALASADFNADGFADLAIGAPWADVATTGGPVAIDAGGVRLLRGSSAGLDTHRNRVYTQEVAGFLDDAENFEHLGWSLTVGDFDGDGFADLGVGAPREGLPGLPQVGKAFLLFGEPKGPSTYGMRQWTLGTGVPEAVPHDNAYFGWALAAGDFDGDGLSDLAMGAHDDFAQPDNRGSVTVIYHPKPDL